MKKLGSYIVYIIFLGLIVYWGLKYEEKLIILSRQAAEINPFPIMIYATIFPVLIGVLIAIPGFISNFNKPGTWNINWIKMLVIGLPTFFVTVAHLMYFLKIGQYLYPVLSSWVLNKDLITISGIIFGYTLLASFNKVDEINRI